MIDKDTYKLSESNFYTDKYDKKQIIIGHTYRTGMLHYAGWVYRLNGKNKKTSAFTINKEGKIYQHFDPEYYGDFIGNIQDKASISIVLENNGWYHKDNVSNRYVDWLGNTFKKNDDEVLMKKWRNHSYWDKYTENQIESLSQLVNKLCSDHSISKNFIGHNVYDENVDIYEGIVFRSNYYQESTDVNPSFDFDFFKKNIL